MKFENTVMVLTLAVNWFIRFHETKEFASPLSYERPEREPKFKMCSLISLDLYRSNKNSLYLVVDFL
jgi:hypothetical protein